jgi:queuine tRNA-ribosyltransferase
MFVFKLLARDNDARVGKLVTHHGTIETPSFVPVGTRGSVRAMSAEELRRIGVQTIIMNSLHLHLQPGEDTIQRMGGLRRFIGWEGPLMTDSGGFQIFTLGAAKEHGRGKIARIFPGEKDRNVSVSSRKGKPLVRLDEDGVEFISYLDGSTHRFTPEQVIEIEQKLGADMILVLDECTSPLHDYDYTKSAMQRTHRWALRALEVFQLTSDNTQAILGIVQGGPYRDLRVESSQFISRQDFDGYALGGSLGRSKEEMHRVLEWTLPFLSEAKPRHLLGIGEIEDIFEAVMRGIDLFDCILPTSMAHTGTFLTKGQDRFRMHILNARFKDDPRPVDEGCTCYTCGHYSRAYLRHLFVVKEALGIRLAAIHNLYFMESLMREIRSAIKQGALAELSGEWAETIGAKQDLRGH